jgi:hypothetical protein
LPEKDYSLRELQKNIESSSPDAPGSWFSTEFEATTGIDILEKSFDVSAKFGMFSDERFKVLVMRVDLENDIKQQLVSEFVGEEIILSNKNEAQNKWYKSLYEDSFANGELSSEWIAKCTKLAYMSNFYSEEEQRRYNRKSSRLSSIA